MILRRLSQHVKDQNWFAVALDFVIVVIGVGVALMGQQWLSDGQQRADMRVAEKALQLDLYSNYYIAKERVAVADCRIETYRGVAAQLLEPGVDWLGLPRSKSEDIFRQALPSVFRSPSRSWGSRVWQAELSRGTFNQMSDERRQSLDGLFKQTDNAEKLQRDIFALQGRLKILAVSTTLSQTEKLRYYEILGEMDDKSALLELMSGQIIQRIESIGIVLPAEVEAEVSDDLSILTARGRDIYGPCFQAQDWPALGINSLEDEAQ